ncbi:chloramphenicol acetyltransferase [Culicoidibacter larvae]|uniref:Chloramphenicol acetyltransferase n=1 Tax=Culicoidibacter larvae TaxID=2579976 RepID=A0A5R8QHH9_9FIRM|nr:chloramphenicol acetyltransferase [Culicoidibacter larvae]TLG76717.1 chloramphenicol acetyltransferase [Culicoidibacter larvae]
MEKIDLATWERKAHFDFFKQFANPHFSMSATVNVTNIYNVTKQNNESIFCSLLFVIMQTLNEIKAFRLRIIDDEVFECSVTHPNCTVLDKNNLFGFCSIDFVDDKKTFIEHAKTRIDRAKEHFSLAVEPRNNVVFFSTIPWVDFTSISHPIQIVEVDSVPRITIGKIHADTNGNKLMLVSIQVHHGLADGYHVGLFFQLLQEKLDSVY